MRILYSALALVALAAVAFADEPTVEDNVYVLGDSTFKDFVADNEFVLAEFYAPWCGHCKSLAPEYAKAAGQLKDEGSAIKLAKVDATIHQKIAGEHGVRGYPTLKFFRSGTPVEYNGGRQAADIVNWLKKRTGPPADTIETVDAHKAMAEKNEVFVIGYFADADSDNAKAFLAAAATFDEGAFGITTSDDVKAELGVEGDAVVLLKHFDEKRNDFDGAFEKDAIVAFINKNNLPLVMPFNQKNQPKIFGGEIKSHMLLFVPKDKFESDFSECYHAAAEKFKGKMMFITVDTKNSAVGNVLRYFMIDSNVPAALRVINMDGDMIKYVPEGEPACDMFEAFAQEFFDGKLTPHYNTEEIPEDWDAEAVKVLVGKNFHEVAMNKSATVFVEFYAPWCGHCKSLAPIWEELGKAFEGRGDVIIAKMDSTANEVPEVKVQGFPTLKLFKAESNEIVDYNGGRTFDELKQFVLKEAGGELPKAEVEDDEEPDEEDTVERDEL